MVPGQRIGHASLGAGTGPEVVSTRARPRPQADRRGLALRPFDVDLEDTDAARRQGGDDRRRRTAGRLGRRRRGAMPRFHGLDPQALEVDGRLIASPEPRSTVTVAVRRVAETRTAFELEELAGQPVTPSPPCAVPHAVPMGPPRVTRSPLPGVVDRYAVW